MLWLIVLPLACLALWGPLSSVSRPAAAAEDFSRVTTENLEYCEALSARLAAIQRPAADASRDWPHDLGEEGRRLCANGHVRTGIAKLRRALRATRAELRLE